MRFCSAPNRQTVKHTHIQAACSIHARIYTCRHAHTCAHTHTHNLCRHIRTLTHARTHIYKQLCKYAKYAATHLGIVYSQHLKEYCSTYGLTDKWICLYLWTQLDAKFYTFPTSYWQKISHFQFSGLLIIWASSWKTTVVPPTSHFHPKFTLDLLSRYWTTNATGLNQVEILVRIWIFHCKKPIASLINSKNKDSFLHCMLAGCSCWDAA